MPNPPIHPTLTGDPMPEDEVAAIYQHAEAVAVAAAADGIPDRTAHPPPDLSWQVVDLGRAEWAMARYGEVTARIIEAREQAAEWHARVDDWLAERTRGDAAFATYLGSLLEQYALAARAPKRATLTLPSGKVPTREVPAKATIVDADEVLAWLDERQRERDDVPADAIKRAPLVSKLGGLYVLVDQPTGRLILGLSCGCQMVAELDGVCPDGASCEHPAEDHRVLCAACGADAHVITAERETRLVAVDSVTLEPVPGMLAEPPRIAVGPPKPAN